VLKRGNIDLGTLEASSFVLPLPLHQRMMRAEDRPTRALFWHMVFFAAHRHDAHEITRNKTQPNTNETVNGFVAYGCGTTSSSRLARVCWYNNNQCRTCGTSHKNSIFEFRMPLDLVVCHGYSFYEDSEESVMNESQRRTPNTHWQQQRNCERL
jgi:hypothetical protein